jgi:methylenetetrahydrofolate dehydrogenase (NADP+)/methenyltetrahydrofolate cyclohydrolase
VQLPLPTHLDTEAICAAIPVQKDPDLLSRKAQENFIHSSSVILPPVVAAIDTIFSKYEVSLLDKKVAVIGQGKLVGVPVVTWIKQKGILSLIVDRKMLDDKSCLKEADVIISGAGVLNLITMDMVKDGVVLIDAGTSEAGGKIAGDIDPACAIKAALFTPVPGGVGPVTVAMLFRNLLELSR